MGAFGDSAAAAPFRGWIERVCPCAIPVGVGVVIAGSRIGFRIYTGVFQPSTEGLVAVQGAGQADAAVRLRAFADDFQQTFGPFAPQSVTVGFDFQFHATAGITRTKFDFCCQNVVAEQGGRVWDFVGRRCAAWGRAAGPLDDFRGDLERSFGRASVKFISMGFPDGSGHLTVYARPHNLA